MSLTDAITGALLNTCSFQSGWNSVPPALAIARLAPSEKTPSGLRRRGALPRGCRSWDEPHAARRKRLPPVGQFKAAYASQLFIVEARIGRTLRRRWVVGRRDALDPLLRCAGGPPPRQRSPRRNRPTSPRQSLSCGRRHAPAPRPSRQDRRPQPGPLSRSRCAHAVTRTRRGEKFRRRLDDSKPGSNSALGVVLVRLRISKIGKHAVAHILRDEPAVALDQPRCSNDDTRQLRRASLRDRAWAESAVEPTRSQNITVSWRRSAVPVSVRTGARRGGGVGCQARPDLRSL